MATLYVEHTKFGEYRVWTRGIAPEGTGITVAVVDMKHAISTPIVDLWPLSWRSDMWMQEDIPLWLLGAALWQQSDAAAKWKESDLRWFGRQLQREGIPFARGESAAYRLTDCIEELVATTNLTQMIEVDLIGEDEVIALLEARVVELEAQVKEACDGNECHI